MSPRDKPWLKHYHAGVPASIEFENTLLHHYLEENSRRIPDHPALIYDGFSLSFKAFNGMADAFGAFLQSRGVQKGDAVSLVLPNIIPCPVAFYAVMKIGAVAVMNNPRYADRELCHQFKDSGSTALITLDIMADRMAALMPRTRIKTIVAASMGDFLPVSKKLFFPLTGRRKGLRPRIKPARGLFFWKDVIREYAGAGPGGAGPEINDIALFQYTGGATGMPKGVVLTQGNLSRQIQQLNAWLPESRKSPGEIMLGALPFFHIMGLTISMNLAVTRGWTNVLVPGTKPGPLLEAMEKFRPTVAPMVPAMFMSLLNHPKTDRADLSSLKTCLSGAAPLPLEVIRKFEKKTGALIIEAYGMTEASPATHANPLSRGKRKMGSIGVPLPGTDCRIADPDDPDREVAVGRPGEMLVKGPQIMAGYLNSPKETRSALADGWLRTGDIALMDEEGYFFIVDRKKDMIISEGDNIYPGEIEGVLLTHPGVMEACAIGIPRPDRGEEIKAFVVPAPGQIPTEDELITHCAGRLARYKRPARIRFMDRLPKTHVGKLLRKDLRAMEAAKNIRRNA